MSDDSGYSSRVALPPRTRLAVGGAREATEAMFTEGNRKKRIQGTIFVAILLLGLSVALIAIVAMVTWAIIAGGPRLNLDLFTNVPSVVTPENAGYRTAILGTLYVIGGVIVLIVPLGVGAAVYLEEFANPANKFNRFVDLNIQNLAGVPSIVFGILGLAFIVRGPLDLGFVAAAGSLTIALLVLPTVILASREAIRAVPSSIRDGSMALGATVWQTVWKQVLPAATPGILTGDEDRSRTKPPRLLQPCGIHVDRRDPRHAPRLQCRHHGQTDRARPHHHGRPCLRAGIAERHGMKGDRERLEQSG